MHISSILSMYSKKKMAIVKEKVLEVKHYTDRLFHFKTTRFRYEIS